ncbi:MULTISPECIES: sulfocyanin-like copper-binding protein [Cryobacterium]|uniref:sulfocyanin-like copper-binding protein n=1 Tax=Cryobacterium TaxID=69578 RepID=UPI00141B6EA6|nr:MULTISPECIES: sulfocyanin-like copper-binding protein [Cryobacterium]
MDVGLHHDREQGLVYPAALGSLGEASTTNGQGAGEGITPGAASWVTMDLAPGRYEVLCNLPGHYPAGMYSELTVS